MSLHIYISLFYEAVQQEAYFNTAAVLRLYSIGSIIIVIVMIIIKHL